MHKKARAKLMFCQSIAKRDLFLFFAVLVAVAVIVAFKLKKLLLFFSFFTNRAYYSMLLR